MVSGRHRHRKGQKYGRAGKQHEDPRGGLGEGKRETGREELEPEAVEKMVDPLSLHRSFTDVFLGTYNHSKSKRNHTHQTRGERNLPTNSFTPHHPL